LDNDPSSDGKLRAAASMCFGVQFGRAYGASALREFEESEGDGNVSALHAAVFRFSGLSTRVPDSLPCTWSIQPTNRG